VSQKRSSKLGRRDGFPVASQSGEHVHALVAPGPSYRCPSVRDQMDQPGVGGNVRDLC
jgi:hypothetical protein